MDHALYILMGIALYLVWKSGVRKKKQTAIVLFAIQLVLNFVTVIYFFQFAANRLGMAELVLMWLAILATILILEGYRLLRRGFFTLYFMGKVLPVCLTMPSGV